eukprot:24798-Eustigmatos_ZCMA.PRE.1
MALCMGFLRHIPGPRADHGRINIPILCCTLNRSGLDWEGLLWLVCSEGEVRQRKAARRAFLQ